MRISLSLPQIADPTHPDPYWQSMALAATADELGYDTVTIGHHHFVPGNIPDPLMFMAAVAARTQRLRVGTGIYLLAVHDPVRVAEQVALLDLISGGRAALGVGTGWNELEYRVFGSDIHRRGARIDESIRLMQHLWTTEGEPWHGEFFDLPPLTLHPRPVQRPHPSIAVAGVAAVAVERAARLGQSWLCGPVQSLSQAQQCLSVYRPACERLGKPADWVLRRYAWVGADRDQVANEILPTYVEGLLEHWRESAQGDEELEMFARFDRGEPIDPEAVAADRLVWGTPEQCLEQIRRYRAETGVQHIHLAFGAGLPGGSTIGHFGSFEQLHEMIRLFGTEVLPVLERLGPDDEPVKVSLSLPQFADRSSADPYRQSWELAKAADDLGYDTVTVGQHHFVAGNLPDPVVWLAALSGHTERVRLGTGIVLLAVHDPVRVAEQVALLDLISGGRAVLGVGTGWNELEYRAFGSDIHRRGARIDEALRLLVHLWTTEDEPWHGEFFDVPPLTLHPRPVQLPHPPLMVAGVAGVAVERAARLGDGWICGPVQSLAKVKSCLSTYLAACERLHRPADWVLRRYTWIGGDPDQIRDVVLPAYVDGLLDHWRESAEEPEEKELFARLDRGGLSPTDIAADRLLAGTPEQCVDQILRYREEAGVDHIHLALGAGLPSATTRGHYGTFEEQMEMITLFGTRALPQLRSVGPS